MYIGNEDMRIHHKACNEVKIYFHIGGKVEKSLNKHTKGYKGHLLKKTSG